MESDPFTKGSDFGYWYKFNNPHVKIRPFVARGGWSSSRGPAWYSRKGFYCRVLGSVAFLKARYSCTVGINLGSYGCPGGWVFASERGHPVHEVVSCQHHARRCWLLIDIKPNMYSNDSCTSPVKLSAEEVDRRDNL